jgi:hypothetical protein
VPTRRLHRDISENTAGLVGFPINSVLDKYEKVLDHRLRLSHGLLRASSRIIYCLFVERLMKRRTGPPPIYLASSGTEKMPVAEERLLSLLATLEECRAFLADKASPETGKLLSLAILELRMELHHVTDSELKALCDLMVMDNPSGRDTDNGQGQRLPPYLKLIK